MEVYLLNFIIKIIIKIIKFWTLNIIVCGFVNDDFSGTVLENLKARGVDIIALRCAGYDNVDLDACAQLGIKVVRVPSYRYIIQYQIKYKFLL